MLGYRITFEGETLYVFDLLVPEIFHEGQRKKNAVDSQDNAASTKPVNSRKGFYLDDIVGTFGVPVEEHRKESEVKQMDGYIPSPDLPEQLENVQQSGNEIAERGMQT